MGNGQHIQFGVFSFAYLWVYGVDMATALFADH
jgi:hypothetical protein